MAVVTSTSKNINFFNIGEQRKCSDEKGNNREGREKAKKGRKKDRREKWKGFIHKEGKRGWRAEGEWEEAAA